MATGDDERTSRGSVEGRRWIDIPRDEDAPFYWSRRFESPEATFAEISDRLTTFVEQAEIAYDRRKPVTPPDIARWHRAIFSTTFPEHAGRFRLPAEDDFVFGVIEVTDIDRGEWKPLASVLVAPSVEVESRLQSACEVFDRQRPDRRHSDKLLSPRSAANAVTELFVEVLKVHPFIDGNLRAGMATIARAVGRIGYQPPRLLPRDWEMAAALSDALRPDEKASMEKLRTLIAGRLKPSR